MQSELPIDFARLKRPKPSRKEQLLNLVWKLCPHGPAFDVLLTRRLPELRHLREWNAADCIPGFNTTPVTILQCPVGAWSTPLVDVVVLLKCALGFRSRRILEIGSYLGHTARLLADNTDPETRITTLDEYPEHGVAYRGTPLERKIDRRIGKMSPGCFTAGEKYDLIFVDADHRFESVVNDTQVALKLLADQGVLIWHDYQCENHFNGLNGVPEALKIFSSYLPIVAVKGTWLAVHSRYPGWETAGLMEKQAPPAPSDAWRDQTLRG